MCPKSTILKYTKEEIEMRTKLNTKHIFHIDNVLGRVIIWLLGMPLIWMILSEHSLKTIIAAYALHTLYYFGSNACAKVIDIIRGFKKHGHWL